MASIVAHRDFALVSNGMKILAMNFERHDKRECKKTSYFDIVKSLKKTYPKSELNESNVHASLQATMTPFWNLIYEKEIELKTQKHTEAVEGLYNRKFSSTPLFANEILHPSRRSENYRNRDEFSIGMGIDGNPKTVGFFIKTSAPQGVVTVPPTEVSIIKNKHKIVAKKFEEFIRTSNLSIYHHLDNPTGTWSGISVRSNMNQDTHATIRVNGKIGENIEFDLKSALETELERLQLRDLRSNSITTLFGHSCLEERVKDVVLRLCDDTNFPSNPHMIPELCDIVQKSLKLSRGQSSVLLNINCGSGLMNILVPSLSVGFDIDVSDAIHNAEINESVSRASFYHGPPKVTVPRFFEVASDTLLQNKNISVLINSRESVGHEIIECIRHCSTVNRVVYVTAVPEKQPLYDFINLVKYRFNSTIKNNFSCQPFRFCNAIALDMYPGTKHCEHVFVFKRGECHVHDVKEGYSAEEFAGAGEEPKILSLELSRSGLYVAVADDLKRLTVYNTTSWEIVYRTKVERRINKMVFTSDSSGVITADKSGDSYVYDIKKEKLEGQEDGTLLLGHLSMLTDVKISRDGKFVITSDRDEKIRVSHYPNAYNIWGFCLGHADFIVAMELIGEDRLLSASGDGTMILWNYIKGNQLCMRDPSKDIQILQSSESSMAVVDLKVHETESGVFAIVSIEKYSGLILYKIVKENIEFMSSTKFSDQSVEHYISNSGLVWVLFRTHVEVYEIKDSSLCPILKESPEGKIVDIVKTNVFFKELIVKENKLEQLRKRILDNFSEYLKRKEERLDSHIEPLVKKTKNIL